MNFFEYNIIPESNHPIDYWAYVGDAKGTVEQFHLLYYLYSKHHILLPKSGVPNIVCEEQEILLVSNENCDLLTFSQENLYSMRVDIQYVSEYDLYSQHPSKHKHSLNYRLESEYLDSEVEYHLLRRDNDIWSPKQHGHLKNLLYVNSCDILPYNKNKKFIETGSSCIGNAVF